MAGHSRRDLLKHASLGAAALGAVAAAPRFLAGNSASADRLAEGPTGAPAEEAVVPDGPLMAYIRDPKAGVISVLVGDREVVYHDRHLAARLARAGAACQV